DSFYIQYEKSIPHHLTASDKLIDFIAAQMKFVKVNFGLDVVRTLYIHELNPEHSFLANTTRPLYQILTKLNIEGQKSNEFNTTLHPDIITKLISRAIRGCYYDWCLYGDDYDLVEESKIYFTLLLEGLKNKPFQ